MTLAHHDTTHGDKRRSRETHLLGPQQRGNHNITPRFKPSICLQNHATPQIIKHQRLMRLGNTQLPRQTCVLDTGQRRGSGTTGFARNQNVVCLSLGNT